MIEMLRRLAAAFRSISPDIARDAMNNLSDDELDALHGVLSREWWTRREERQLTRTRQMVQRILDGKRERQKLQ